MKREGWVGGALGLVLLLAMLFGSMGVGITNEIRTGKVEGQVLLEGKRPLPGAIVSFLRVEEDQVLARGQAGVETDKDGKFTLVGLPDGNYTVEVSAKAHDLKQAVRVRIQEGKTSTLALNLAPRDPYLRVYAQRGVFLPEDKPFIQTSGFLKSKALKVQLWKLPMDRLVKGDSIYSVVSELRQKVTPDQPATVSKTFAIEGTDVEGVFEQTLEFDSLSPGAYLGTVTPELADKKEPSGSSVLFYVSDIALIAKFGQGQSNTFVTELKSGEPLAGVTISLATPTGVKPLGETTADGTLQSKLNLPQDQNAVLLAQRGENLAVVNLRDWSEGERGAIHIVTDRPIYRPGDTVHWRAMARSRSGETYAPLTGDAQVKVSNEDGDVLDRSTASLGRFGTASGSFALPEGDVRPVTFEIEANGVSGSKWVTVSSYRKPAFDVEVIPESKVIIKGDRARMKVRCTYFFGGPVVGARITGSATQQALWWAGSPDDEFEYEDEGYGDGEWIADLPEATTNDAGEAWIEFSTGAMNADNEFEVDQELQFKVAVTEDDERYYEGTGRMKVVRGDRNLLIEPEAWVVQPGQPMAARITVLDLDDKPVLGAKVTVDVGWEQWHDNGVVFVKSQSKTVTTDASGKARIEVPAERGGSYRFIARLRDTRGRPVESVGYVWAYEEGGDWSTESDLEIALDRKEYKPGETVTAIIRSRLKDASIWVTMETDRVTEQKVVKLKNGAAEVSLVAPSSLAANAFVSAQTVSNRTYYQRTKSFRTGLDRQKLNVTVTPDRPAVKPGERIGVTIDARDAEGNPVAAEFSVGIVDEAIYAIREDRDDPLDTFFPRRWSSVNTSYSFPEVYLDGGDKDAKAVQIRKDFRDTAAWVSSVVTDAQGKAKTTVQLPDNITGWRATAVGITTGTEIGKTTAKFVAKKDLMVRLLAPAFLNQFDETGLTAMIQNGTDQPMDATIDLLAEGVDVTNRAQIRIQLKAGESKPVRWQLRNPVPGKAKVTAIARAASGPSDGMELSFPVASFGIDEVIAQQSMVQPDAPLNVAIPSLQTNGQGSVVVDIAATRMDALVSALDDLVDYPYGCVEQTMSRFVPAVQVRATLGMTGQQDAQLIAKIDEVTRQSLQRLQSMQHSDGGFGWWENDASNQRMTAIVLDGLAEAKAAGLNVEGRWVQRALEWAASDLQSMRDNPKAERDAWTIDPIGLSAAALRHRPMPVAAQTLAAQKVEQVKSVRSLARLAEGLEPFNRDLAQDALDAALRLNAAGADESWWWEGNAAKAQLLKACVALGAPETDAIADDLMARRSGRGWRSTYETGQILSAFARLSRSSDQATPGASQVSLSFGDSVIQTFTMGGSGERRVRLKLTEDQLRTGQQLSISSVGGGVYASVSGSIRNPQEDIQSESKDKVVITRSLHRLVAGKSSEGRTALMADRAALTKVKSGDLVRCQVRVVVESDLDFALVEVPIPSNMRVQESLDVEYWSYWFSGMEIMDDKVAFFAHSLPKGEHLFEFHLRAEQLGKARILPARVMPMYRPTEVSRSASLMIEVE